MKNDQGEQRRTEKGRGTGRSNSEHRLDEVRHVRRGLEGTELIIVLQDR